MKNKVPRERVIFDNYSLDEIYPDKEIREILAENGNEDASDEDIWNYRHELSYDDLKRAKEELTDFFYRNGNKWIIFGTVGRWDGVHKAGTIFESFNDFFYEATKDCEYLKFYDENGHLYLTCSHHDGTCCYEIKEVTNKGIQYYENWENSEPKRKYLPIQERFDRIYEKGKSSYICRCKLQILQDMINELDMIPRQKKEVLECLEEWENRFGIVGYTCKDKTEEYIHNQIINRYSRLPRFAEKIYGCKRTEYEPITKNVLINKLNNQARSFYC